MVRLKASRPILTILVGLLLGCFYSGSAFAAQLWSNRTGSLVRSSDGNANWISYDYWNNLLSGAAADGAGGVVSTASESVLVANEVSVPMTMTEASSAAELAAATAFLPETALYAVAGAALGALLWDAATQSYTVPGTDPTTDTGVCPDGSAALWFEHFSQHYFASLGALISYQESTHSYSFRTNGGNSSGVLIQAYYGGQWNDFEYTALSCESGAQPTISLAPVPVPPSEISPYILPWLQSNPSEAPPLARKEAQAGDYPQSSPPLLSGPSSVLLPPVTTTTVNPDGSTTSTTKKTTETITYSGPNASASPTTVTTTTTTPAPTASNPSPSSTSTTTTTTTSPVAPPSSAPASAPSPFTPPDASVPTVQPVPPGVIQLPLPNIDTTGGQCPAPIVMQLGLPGLQTATLDLTPWCNLAAELKPLVLTAGALAAMFILVK